MAETHIISGLTTKRAELAGEIQSHQSKIDKIQLELAHIDGAIKIFDPTYNVKRIKPVIKRKGSPWFKYGELSLLILDVLREAQSPLTKNEILDHIIELKSLEIDDDERETIGSNLRSSLNNHKKRKVIKNSKKDSSSGEFVWEIA